MKHLPRMYLLFAVLILSSLISCDSSRFRVESRVQEITTQPSSVSLSSNKKIRVGLRILHDEITSLHIIIRYSSELRFDPSQSDFVVRWGSGFRNGGILPVMCSGESIERNDKYIVFKIEEHEFILPGFGDEEVQSVGIGFNLEALTPTNDATILATARRRFRIEGCSEGNPGPDVASSISIIP
jgi:hypothetical protein